MPKSRKTFRVADLKATLNARLLNTPDDAKGQRLAIQCVIEDLLHETGNYRGFGYLTPDDMRESEHGKTPGINHAQADKFEGMDRTRVFYH